MKNLYIPFILVGLDSIGDNLSYKLDLKFPFMSIFSRIFTIFYILFNEEVKIRSLGKDSLIKGFFLIIGGIIRYYGTPFIFEREIKEKEKTSFLNNFFYLLHLVCYLIFTIRNTFMVVNLKFFIVLLISLSFLQEFFKIYTNKSISLGIVFLYSLVLFLPNSIEYLFFILEDDHSKAVETLLIIEFIQAFSLLFLHLERNEGKFLVKEGSFTVLKLITYLFIFLILNLVNLVLNRIENNIFLDEKGFYIMVLIDTLNSKFFTLESN